MQKGEKIGVTSSLSLSLFLVWPSNIQSGARRPSMRCANPNTTTTTRGGASPLPPTAPSRIRQSAWLAGRRTPHERQTRVWWLRACDDGRWRENSGASVWVVEARGELGWTVGVVWVCVCWSEFKVDGCVSFEGGLGFKSVCLRSPYRSKFTPNFNFLYFVFQNLR